MRIDVLAATLAGLTFVSDLQAKKVSGGHDPDRKASTVFIFSESSTVLAGASISYSQPDWQDSYDGMLEKNEYNYTRLGKGWWTTFDTVGTIEIGGTKVEAGSYYLGLALGKDGAFSLLVFDSKQTMKAGLLPGTTALYTGEAKPEARAPLTLAKNSLKEVVVKLEIEIVADIVADIVKPATGVFSIRWGRHELSAPVKFHLAGAKDAADSKK